MNETAIENLLFRAPIPAASQELLQRLQTAIILQPAKSETRIPRVRQGPFRRWFPALAFGLVLVSCAVMFAVQSNWSAKLKQQNETLRAVAAGLPQLREQHAIWEKAIAQQQELDGLRKDNQELHQLQAELSRLGGLSTQLQQLREQNHQLSAAPVVSNPSSGGKDFFDEAQQRNERTQCVNNLKQLGIAMRIWAGDNNDKYPTSLVIMSNELDNTTKILICPSDKARQNYSTLSFGEFQDNMTSYQYLAQPDDEKYPVCITAICPIHHNYLLADGSVQMINPEHVHEVKRDGRLYLFNPDNPDAFK